MSNEKKCRRDFIRQVEAIFARNRIAPPAIRAKFMQAPKEYGPLQLRNDWLKELEEEVWDGVMYAGLQRLKEEFFSFPDHARTTEL